MPENTNSSSGQLSYNWKVVTDSATIASQTQEKADTWSYATWYTFWWATVTPDTTVSWTPWEQPTDSDSFQEGTDTPTDTSVDVTSPDSVQSSAQDLVDYASSSEEKITSLKNDALITAEENKVADTERVTAQAKEYEELINNQNSANWWYGAEILTVITI